MKDIDPLVFLAVFQEMLGPLLWVLLFLVLFATFAFVVLLWRERGLTAGRLVRAQVFGIPGGALALVLMAQVSSSGFTDAGGPADWLLIALVFGLGFIGATMLVYVIGGWRKLCKGKACKGEQTQALRGN